MKLLGLTIDILLSFCTTHIEQLTIKLSKILYLIRQLTFNPSESKDIGNIWFLSSELYGSLTLLKGVIDNIFRISTEEDISVGKINPEYASIAQNTDSFYEMKRCDVQTNICKLQTSAALTEVRTDIEVETVNVLKYVYPQNIFSKPIVSIVYYEENSQKPFSLIRQRPKAFFLNHRHTKKMKTDKL